MVDLLNRNGFITCVMNPFYTSVLTILAAGALIGSIGASFQQHASAIVIDGCKQFKKLTNEFEKAALEAGAMGDTAEISRLLDEYSRNVMTAFETPCR